MEYYIKKNDVVSLLMKEAKSHGLSFSAEAYERAANIVACMPNEDVQPVKHGKWEQGKCTNCEKSLEDLFSGDFYWDDDELHFCPNCGARMIRDGETVLQDRCSNYCDCDGSCFIDDTPCDCAGNIEKCKGR